MKAVEAFLLEGDAESYVGVSVLLIEDGRDPTMVVKEQNGGKVRQRIELKQYNTLEELNGLMKKLGFQKRTKREYEKYKAKQEIIQQNMDRENAKKSYEQAQKMVKKKDDIAAKVLKMMEDNLKKQQDNNNVTKVKV